MNNSKNINSDLCSEENSKKKLIKCLTEFSETKNKCIVSETSPISSICDCASKSPIKECVYPCNKSINDKICMDNKNTKGKRIKKKFKKGVDKFSSGIGKVVSGVGSLTLDVLKKMPEAIILSSKISPRRRYRRYGGSYKTGKKKSRRYKSKRASKKKTRRRYRRN